MKADAALIRRPAFIVSSHARLYLGFVMVRFLSSLVVALALFLSPLAMASGAGMAMPSAAAATGAGSHCAGSEAPSDADNSLMEMSCASSCAAYSPDPLIPAANASASPAKPIVMKPRLLAGIHPEGETPPPRITPEI